MPWIAAPAISPAPAAGSPTRRPSSPSSTCSAAPRLPAPSLGNGAPPIPCPAVSRTEAPAPRTFSTAVQPPLPPGFQPCGGSARLWAANPSPWGMFPICSPSLTGSSGVPVLEWRRRIPALCKIFMGPGYAALSPLRDAFLHHGFPAPPAGQPCGLRASALGPLLPAGNKICNFFVSSLFLTGILCYNRLCIEFSGQSLPSVYITANLRDFYAGIAGPRRFHGSAARRRSKRAPTRSISAPAPSTPAWAQKTSASTNCRRR